MTTSADSDVAQVSKPAVSPISKSADHRKPYGRSRCCAPAGFQTCDTAALKICATASANALVHGRSAAGLGVFLLLFYFLFGVIPLWAGGGFLQIRNGYFWDPVALDYFIPRGIAYQTWNPPVGADQSFAQIDYDLVEFKKMHANSLRVEMVWNVVETAPGVFDWSKPDYLVAKAEELGLRLFVLIGFQYAPDWFPNDWKAVNDQGGTSVVVNYEHPQARLAYSNYIFQVTSRYQHRAAIGGWILGNEYAYFDLWNVNRQFLGFDSYSQASFRSYLSSIYAGNIGALNANWTTAYPNFSSVIMPLVYPSNRHAPGYHDLIQWRKKSIGDYVAVGAVAARAADPNHLLTYSMVGGIFSGNDALNTCEDAKTIVARCAAAGAPLQFWSINNYAWAIVGNEMRSADFGVHKYQAQSGLPVMVSETGHSSTDNFLPGAGPRQPKTLPSQMWEMLSSGAIGMHVFTWNDRDIFSGYDFIRERGFGFVQQNRLIKDPVFWNVQEAFRRMENIQASHLFGGSLEPPKDVQFFWSIDSDMGWNRANMENAMLWGAFKRVGYQPGIIDDAQFERGDYTNAPALLLSRCYQMDPAHLDHLASQVIAAGIHLHADADLPGQFNAYNHPNSAWAPQMNLLFGLNVTNAVPAWDSGATELNYDYFTVTAIAPLGNVFTPGYAEPMNSWKIWQGLSAIAGTTIATHRGINDSQPPIPALQLKNIGTARTAFNSFGLGDVDVSGAPVPPTNHWHVHSYWLRAIYRDHFGIIPKIDLSGPGAEFVKTDYRLCRNGSILISLLNEHTNDANVTLTAPNLIAGKTVENLTGGGVLTTNSNGALILPMAGDDYLLLYVYPKSAGADGSLLNPDPNKIWIESAPPAVWPNGVGYDLSIGYDTVETNLNLFVTFERILFPGKLYSQSVPLLVGGAGSQKINLPIPDADLNDSDYVSSRDGGEYIFRARLEKNGIRLSESVLPVRLLWGVRPISLPSMVLPSNTYSVPLEWQELPSYEPAENPTPLSRAALWQPLLARAQNYEVVLELRTNGVAVVSDRFLTSSGTSNHQFSIHVPGNVLGPFSWFAYLRTAPNASSSLFDSFEDRDPGDFYQILTNTLSLPPIVSPISPWVSYNYPGNGNQQWFTEGVGTNASDGKLSGFLVVTNPPWIPSANYSGFGITYSYVADWALPNDSRQWTNFAFSCDFKENSGHACIIELQINDAYGGQIHFTNRYVGGPGGWQTIKASLDRFTLNPNLPYPPGFFARGRVHQLAINVQMLDTNVTYAASFDNIRFDGPEALPAGVTSHDVIDSFEDRQPGLDPTNGPSLMTPWTPYVYAESNNVADSGRGIQSFGSDGGQSAFEVVQNPANPGAFSGFGIYSNFTNEWALPPDRSQWTNYTFAFDFNEARGYRCILELQVKSSPNNWMSFTRTNNPSASNQWTTLRASLDQFIPGPGGPLDPAHVQALAVNIQMLDKNVTYLGSFDNIRFDGPDIPEPADLRYGIYDSSNDGLRDSDGDGIPDIYETGTGIYVSPTNTGTSPNNPDSDGDGLSDRFELIAGTDPNSASSVFRIESIRRSSDGSVAIAWLARTNKIYGIEYFDGSWFDGAPFCPLEGGTGLSAITNGLLQVLDPSATNSALRFYRISVQNP